MKKSFWILGWFFRNFRSFRNLRTGRSWAQMTGGSCFIEGDKAQNVSVQSVVYTTALCSVVCLSDAPKWTWCTSFAYLHCQFSAESMWGIASSSFRDLCRNCSCVYWWGMLNRWWHTLAFISLPKSSKRCYWLPSYLCFTVFVTLSFSVLYFFIIFFFWEPLVPPHTDVPVLVVCLRDLFLHERHSLYLQALAWVSQHNSSATLLKLSELIMPRCLSLLSSAPLFLIHFGILVSYDSFSPEQFQIEISIIYMFTI